MKSIIPAPKGFAVREKRQILQWAGISALQGACAEKMWRSCSRVEGSLKLSHSGELRKKGHREPTRTGLHLGRKNRGGSVT